MRFGAEDLPELFSGASRLTVAKGKKVLHYDLTREPLAPEDLARAVLGPSGNLRAPTIRTGKSWTVGFNAEAWGETLG